jgi:hypothetical protein
MSRRALFDWWLGPRWAGTLWWLAATFLLLGPASARAQAGPPLITDDPDTPGPGYWGINIATILSTAADGTEFEASLADINYGVGTQRVAWWVYPQLEINTSESMAAKGLANVGALEINGEIGRSLCGTVKTAG